MTGSYHITIDSNIPPVQHAHKHISIEQRESIEQKLNEMSKSGVIFPKWTHSLNILIDIPKEGGWLTLHLP